MITKPTVLVLGAGASKPYGYPLGGDLVEHILSGFSHKASTFRKFGVKTDEVNDFISELYYAQQPSVDAFLEHLPEFHSVGKLVIAMSLVEREDESKLLDFSRRAYGFYNYLFSKLNTSWEDFANNQLSVITFNYDRSLEHYLFTSLKHTHNKSDEAISDALPNIPIIHVHGSLGPLPWQETGGINYLLRHKDGTIIPDKQDELIDVARKRILIVSEQEKSTNEFNQAFECLKSAERIYFLGFGYHEPNLKKLKLDELIICDAVAYNDFVYRASAQFKHFRGSALNLRTSQKKVVQRQWGIGLPDSELNDLEFLKEYAELD